MNVFNEEQLGYIKYLQSLPPNFLCECGWYRKEECDYEKDGLTGHCPYRFVKATRDGIWKPPAAKP